MSQDAFRQYYTHFPEPLLLVSGTGLIEASNQAAAEFLDNSSGQFAGRSLASVAAEPAEKIDAFLKTASRTRAFTPGSITLTLRNGKRIAFRADAGLWEPASAGRPARLLIRLRPKETPASPFLALNEKIRALAKEITERKRTEAELREQRSWLATILSSIGDAVIATDSAARIAFMNPVAEQLTGWNARDAAGQPLETVFATVNELTREACENPVSKVLQEGNIVSLANHTALVTRDGRELSIDDSAAPIRNAEGRIIGVVLIFRDITETKRTEEQLRQTQKLESLGVLAGGIAHDFNNLLTGIMGNASLAIDGMPEGDPARRLLQNIVQASERAAHLTRQMLAYSGKGQFIIERINLSEAVRELVPLLRMSIPKKVDLRMDLAPQLPPIEADPAQVQQLVMNLVINAGEAIGDQAPGLILLATGTEEIENQNGLCGVPVHNLHPGTYVYLEVRDNGCGMDPATKERIFDPFFTTKFTGRGLGLAAVLGIVRSNKGLVQVDSTPGRGTTFKVLLPAHGASHSVPRARPAEDRKLILVVDDEDMVRSVSKLVLERSNYRVLLANNGKDAVEMFRTHEDIAAVLLDMTMPVMSGEDALAHMLAIRPGVPVLILSGYSESEVLRRLAGLKISGFLQKPFTSARLIEATARALGRSEIARAG